MVLCNDAKPALIIAFLQLNDIETLPCSFVKTIATVDPKQLVLFTIGTLCNWSLRRPELGDKGLEGRGNQSWETTANSCKAEADTAAQRWKKAEADTAAQSWEPK